MSGLHVNSLLWEHEEYIGRVRPGVNLLLNPKVEQALILKGRSPESKLIGRVTIPPGDGVVHSWYLSPGTVDGAKTAGKRAAEYCMAQGVPQIDAWTVNNEPPVELLDHIRLLAEFDSEFARAMHKAGKRACIGTFSRGTPQIPQEDGGAALSTYAPALRVAHEVGAWLAFHSYGKYPLFHDADFLALRWQRRILPWYRAQGVPIPRYVITEAGVDRGTGIDAQNSDGWRNTPYKDDIAAYGRDLLALMQEYAKDPACLGATIFCAGHAGWESFVVNGPLLDHLATLSWPKFGVAAPIPTPTPAPPVPTPKPTPTPAPPKEDTVDLPSWVKVEKATGEPGQQVWKLAKAVYLPPEGEGEPNSQGRHHIEILEPHDPSRRVAIHNKQTGELWTLPLDKPSNEPAQNHPMYGEPNNYSAYMTGAPSDVVSGLVMKGNRHVVYRLWFELVKVPETTPTPPTIPGVPAMPVFFRYSKPLSVHSSDRTGRAIQYLILHTTESPLNSDQEETLDYFVQNERQVSTNDYLAKFPDGSMRLYNMVPYARAAHHAGGVKQSDGTYSSRLPNGYRGHECNMRTIGLEIYRRIDTPLTADIVTAAIEWAAERCKQFDLTTSQILSHKMVDPSRRSDPVGIDLVWFRDKVGERLGAMTVVTPKPPLPEDESLLDLKMFLQKAAWWAEEQERQYVIGQYARASAIRQSMVKFLARGRDKWGR